MTNPSRRRLRLEPLEARRAPANLGDPKTLIYQDTDGDTVTVALSRPLPAGTDPNTIFKFDVGGVNELPNSPQQLQTIDLTTLPKGLSVGVAVTTTVGDGLVNVGWVNGTGVDLGNIGIAGDLGRITAGDVKAATPGLGILAVGSLGGKGITTQATGGTLSSLINGKLASLLVAGDVVEASVRVTGNSSGKIGKIGIGGSLRGGTDNNTGVIEADGDIGPVVVHKDVVGGAGDGASIYSYNGRITSITIGRLIGNGPGSANLIADSIGSLSVIGYQLPGPVTVAGDIIGGAGGNSARIQVSRIGPVTVTGDWKGGAGAQSASLLAFGGMGNPAYAEGHIASIKIGGTLSGDGRNSGQIVGENQTGAVTIGGSVRGGDGLGSGSIQSTYIKSVKIGGDVQGGKGKYSGDVMSGLVFEAAFGRPDYILAWGTIKTVTIAGSVIGDEGQRSGMILGGQGLGTVTVTGDVRGGIGYQSGIIRASGVTPYVFEPSVGGKLTSITIGGSLKGFDGDGSGSVISNEDIGSVKISGSMIGAIGVDSGSVTARRSITKSVTVVGDVQGGSGAYSASMSAGSKIGSVTVNGSVVGGTGSNSASILAGLSIGPVKVLTDWTGANIIAGVSGGVDGDFGNSDDRAVAGSAIKGITIGGKVEGTAGGTDSFVFEANRVGSLLIGMTATVLNRGPGNDLTAQTLGTHGDFVVLEAALA